MILLIAKYIETSQYERLDEKTGTKRIDKSYRVHVAYPDGTVMPETVYFPRDPMGKYREPQLEHGESYTFPVTVRPTKDGKKVSFTALLDKPPFPAPKNAPRAA